MRNTSNKHKKYVQAAREIRYAQSDAEKVLWNALRNRRLTGLRFYRQRVIGPFIADFYCAAARLVIEVDGDIHDFQVDYDAKRTWQLEGCGYRVIRFRNDAVIRDLKFVLSQIESVARDRIYDLTPNPSPENSRWEADPTPGLRGGW